MYVKINLMDCVGVQHVAVAAKGAETSSFPFASFYVLTD